MNFFILDTNPYLCAQYHCDKHLVSQIKEAAQMLSHYCWELEIFNNNSQLRNCIKMGDRWYFTPPNADNNSSILICSKLKGGHSKHPCVKWLFESPINRDWAAKLLISLIDEYFNRFKKRHAYADVAEFFKCWFSDSTPKIPHKFAEALPFGMHGNSTVEKYRYYYKTVKRPIAKWNRSTQPDWF
jgi:hypothetical protein